MAAAPHGEAARQMKALLQTGQRRAPTHGPAQNLHGGKAHSHLFTYNHLFTFTTQVTFGPVADFMTMTTYTTITYYYLHYYHHYYHHYYYHSGYFWTSC